MPKYQIFFKKSVVDERGLRRVNWVCERTHEVHKSGVKGYQELKGHFASELGSPRTGIF